eukprot:Rmarinus@m.9877
MAEILEVSYPNGSLVHKKNIPGEKTDEQGPPRRLSPIRQTSPHTDALQLSPERKPKKSRNSQADNAQNTPASKSPSASPRRKPRRSTFLDGSILLGTPSPATETTMATSPANSSYEQLQLISKKLSKLLKEDTPQNKVSESLEFLRLSHPPELVTLDRHGPVVTQAQVIATARRSPPSDDANKGILGIIGDPEKEADVFRKFKQNPDVLLERGPVGETPLHLTFLLKNPTLGTTLIRMYGATRGETTLKDVVNVAYTLPSKSEYEGETCLHIAIVNRDYDTCRFLLELGADPNCQATGSFFHPVELGGTVYYGEFPLNFAICTAQADLVRLLMCPARREHKGKIMATRAADPMAQDSYGNTALHMMVVHNLPSMLCCFTGLANERDHYAGNALGPTMHKLMAVKNGDGYTPLRLAAKLGMKEMVATMIEMSKEVVWSYGPVTCAAFPLDEIDSLADTADRGLSFGRIYEKGISRRSLVSAEPAYKPMFKKRVQRRLGALSSIVAERHLELLQVPFISAMLKEKWRQFGKPIFYVQLCVNLLYYAAFQAALMIRPLDPVSRRQYTSPTDYFRLSLELLVLIPAFSHVLGLLHQYISAGDVVRSLPSVNALSSFCRFMSVIFSFSVISAAVGRYMERDGEDELLAASSLCYICYLLYFIGGFEGFGVQVIVVYKMISDIARFSIMYFALLFGFSQALYSIYYGLSVEGFESPLDSMRTLFLLSIEFYHPVLVDDSLPFMGLVLLLLFAVLVVVLLMNLLIAMMNHTYDEVTTKAELEWRLQWADIILEMERKRTSWSILPWILRTVFRWEVDYQIGTKYPNEEAGTWHLIVQEVTRTREEDG